MNSAKSLWIQGFNPLLVGPTSGKLAPPTISETIQGRARNLLYIMLHPRSRGWLFWWLVFFPHHEVYKAACFWEVPKLHLLPSVFFCFLSEDFIQQKSPLFFFLKGYMIFIFAHTHTHIYIYIYIHIKCQNGSSDPAAAKGRPFSLS